MALSPTRTEREREKPNTDTAHTAFALVPKYAGHDWGRALVAPAWTRGDLQLPATKKVVAHNEKRERERKRALTTFVFSVFFYAVRKTYI